ncbi:hypothetical protein [Sulfurimonas sp.]
MKHSIKKIFKNLNFYLFTALILALISFGFITEQYFSYKKIENLNTQKSILNKLLNSQKDTNKIDIIMFNNEIAKLHNKIEKLSTQYKNSYLSIYLLNNKNEYNSELSKLNDFISKFDKTSKTYFDSNIYDKIFSTSRSDIRIIHNSILNHIDLMILKNIEYDKTRFNLFSKIFALLVLILFVTTIWYRSRLNKIYKDIIYLYNTDAKKDEITIFSQEIDGISKRMYRKTKPKDNSNNTSI